MCKRDHPLRLGAEMALDIGLASAFVASGTALGLATTGIGLCTPLPRSGKQPVPSMLDGDARTVTADDGVRLHAEVTGAPDAPVTVVLCHGLALNQGSWKLQREVLARRARVISWDHRGHGRSEKEPGHLTIDQLGADLFAVLEKLAPAGPVVLVGYSMGGMAIMALAERHPELFGERVQAVALLATTASGISSDFGLPPYTARALKLAAPGALNALSRQLLPNPQWAFRALTRLLTRNYAFASDVPEALVEFVAEMIRSTPLGVLAGLFADLLTHHRVEALDTLRRVETLVMVGDGDRLTPVQNGMDIVRALPGAELVITPRAGHGLIFERPELVNLHLENLLNRVVNTRSFRSADLRGPVRQSGALQR